MIPIVSNSNELAEYRLRYRWMYVISSFVFLLLIARFAYLQLFNGSYYYRLSQNNFVRERELPADRGLIRDSRGRLIATNRPSYSVAVIPSQMESNPETLANLADLLKMDQEEYEDLKDRIASVRAARRLEQFSVQRDITRDQLALLETHRENLKGMEILSSSHRYYPYGQSAAHLMGFMNEVSREEIEAQPEEAYKAGEYVGRKGIERYAESLLRGISGMERIIVDVRGNRTDAIRSPYNNPNLPNPRKAEAIPGKNITLTIDMELQLIVEHAMRDREAGGVVAVEPSTGRVLALYSKPTFDPNAWTGRLTREEKERVDTDPFKPMIDKALSAYFPGSVYKLVTGLAALEEGVTTPKETINCPGFYTFGNRRFRCWNRSGHGRMNLKDALKNSCDVYFYVMAERLGIDTLANYGREFGFGSRTGIDISGESPGLVPTRKWHTRNSSIGFQHGFSLSTAIGQGDTMSSPLQMTMAFAALANAGILHKPQLTSRIELANGDLLTSFRPEVRHKVNAKPEHLRLLHESMVAAVNERGGTAFNVRSTDFEVAGKTGTAQVAALDRPKRSPEEERMLGHHAWFVGYAPAQSPKIVVTVFLQHGGGGGTQAAPVAMEIIDRYLIEVLGLEPDRKTASAPGRTPIQSSATANLLPMEMMPSTTFAAINPMD